MLLNISGIPIDICKKNVKNIRLYVKPPHGKVTVSAPISMSDEAIERFVQAKIGWIKKHISKFNSQPHRSEGDYVSGETMYVWGNQYFIQTKCDSKNALVLCDNKAVLSIRKESTAIQREKFIHKWYREHLKTEIEQLLPKWEKITGLKAASWQTKYMTTRWGTCNTKTRKIWLNLQLAKYPPECLEYVILHELLHLIERKHNEHFFALMDKYMPKWRAIKATLNSHIF